MCRYVLISTKSLVPDCNTLQPHKLTLSLIYSHIIHMTVTLTHIILNVYLAALHLPTKINEQLSYL